MCRIAAHGRDDNIERLRGAGRPHPWESAIALLGAFSLVGFPLTVGFPGRWGLGLALFSSSDPSGWALALGVAGGTVACLHWVGHPFRRGRDGAGDTPSTEGSVLSAGRCGVAGGVGCIPAVVVRLGRGRGGGAPGVRGVLGTYRQSGSEELCRAGGSANVAEIGRPEGSMAR